MTIEGKGSTTENVGLLATVFSYINRLYGLRPESDVKLESIIKTFQNGASFKKSSRQCFLMMRSMKCLVSFKLGL